MRQQWAVLARLCHTLPDACSWYGHCCLSLYHQYTCMMTHVLHMPTFHSLSNVFNECVVINMQWKYTGWEGKYHAAWIGGSGEYQWEFRRLAKLCFFLVQLPLSPSDSSYRPEPYILAQFSNNQWFVCWKALFIQYFSKKCFNIMTPYTVNVFNTFLNANLH